MIEGITRGASSAASQLADARAELKRRQAELEALAADKAEAEAAWLSEAEAGEETKALREKRDAFHAAELREREAQHRVKRAHDSVEVAERALEEAREAERLARLKSVAEDIIKVDHNIDRTRRKLAGLVKRRQDLGDEAVIARAGKPGGPSLRQIRAQPALAGFIFEALWAVLPGAVPRPAGGYHRYAGLTAFERQIFRPWLNGTVDEAATPSIEEKEDE